MFRFTILRVQGVLPPAANRVLHSPPAVETHPFSQTGAVGPVTGTHRGELEVQARPPPPSTSPQDFTASVSMAFALTLTDGLRKKRLESYRNPADRLASRHLASRHAASGTRGAAGVPGTGGGAGRQRRADVTGVDTPSASSDAERGRGGRPVAGWAAGAAASASLRFFPSPSRPSAGRRLRARRWPSWCRLRGPAEPPSGDGKRGSGSPCLPVSGRRGQGRAGRGWAEPGRGRWEEAAGPLGAPSLGRPARGGGGEPGRD